MIEQIEKARRTTHQERIVPVEMRELKGNELENVGGGSIIWGSVVNPPPNPHGLGYGKK